MEHIIINHCNKILNKMKINNNLINKPTINKIINSILSNKDLHIIYKCKVVDLIIGLMMIWDVE